MNSISEIVECFKSGKTVVFAGAGISYNSGIPIVDQLIPEILDILNIEASDRGKLYGTDNRLIIPFELFIQICSSCCDIEKILDIYEIGEPNANHILLAKLMSQEKIKTICTTNFDLLMERALEIEGMKANVDYDLLYKTNQFAKISLPTKKPRVIKIHGSIEDRKQMANTLDEIARGDRYLERENIIKEIFSTGRHENVLVLGYSCSDAFDLTPMIESLSSNSKQVLFIWHQKGTTIDNAQFIPSDISIAATSFKKYTNATVISCDTDELIKGFWDKVFGHPAPLFRIENTKWKYFVRTWYETVLQNGKYPASSGIIGQLFYSISAYNLAQPYLEDAAKKAELSRDHGLMATWFLHHAENDREIPDYKEAAMHYELAYNYCEQHDDLETCRMILREIKSLIDKIKDLANTEIVYTELTTLYNKLIGNYETPKIRVKNNQIHLISKILRKIKEFCNHPIENNIKLPGHSSPQTIQLAEQALLLFNKGDCDSAIKLNLQALKLFHLTGDKRSQATIHGNIGHIYMYLGHFARHDKDDKNASIYFKEAKIYFEKSLEISRLIGHKEGMAEWMGYVGNAILYDAKNRFEHTEAVKMLLVAVEMAEEINNRELSAKWFESLGDAFEPAGQPGEMVTYYLKAYNIFKQIYNSKNPSLKILIGKLKKLKKKGYNISL